MNLTKHEERNLKKAFALMVKYVESDLPFSDLSSRQYEKLGHAFKKIVKHSKLNCDVPTWSRKKMYHVRPVEYADTFSSPILSCAQNSGADRFAYNAYSYCIDDLIIYEVNLDTIEHIINTKWMLEYVSKHYPDIGFYDATRARVHTEHECDVLNTEMLELIPTKKQVFISKHRHFQKIIDT